MKHARCRVEDCSATRKFISVQQDSWKVPDNRFRTSRRGLITSVTGVTLVTAGCLGSSNETTTEEPTNTPASPLATTTPTQTPQATATPTETTTQRRETTAESDSLNPAEEEAGPAEFNVTAIDAPDQVQIGVEAPISIDIKNVGAEGGTLTSGVSYGRGGTPQQWTGISDASIEMEFEAGETKTYSHTITWPFIGTIQLRYDELYTTIELEFVKRVLSRDETYQTPVGLEIAIDDVGSQSHFTYIDHDGTERKKFPHREDAKYLYIDITATNVADELVETPTPREFFATNSVEEGQHHTAERIHRERTDWKFLPGKRLNAGQSASGKLLFMAAKDTIPAEIAFGIGDRLDEGEYEAYWVP